MLSIRRNRQNRFVVIILTALLLLHAVCFAQTSGGTAAPSPEELQKKILDDKARLQEEMKKIEELLSGATGDEERRSFEELADILQKIDIVYEQQLVQVKRSFDLSQTLEQIKKENVDAKGQAEVGKTSYPFSQLDELEDKLFLLQEQTAAFEEDLKTADSAHQAALGKLKGKQQELRRIREEYEGRGEDPEQALAVILARWSERLVEEELSLRNVFMENEKLENAIHQLKITSLQRKTRSLQGRVRFTKEELDTQLAGIEDEIAGLRKRLEQAKEKKSRAELRWQKAVRQTAPGSGPPAEAAEREKEVENLKLWYDARNAEVMLISQLISLRNNMKKLLQYNYELFHNTPVVNISGWKEEISEELKQLEQFRQAAGEAQTRCLNEIIIRNEALASADKGSKVPFYLEEQIRALKTREGFCREYLEAVQKMGWEYKKLLAAIQARDSHITFEQRIERYGIVLSRIWQYELTSVDDHPITVGKVITAVLLLIIGFFLSKRLTLQMAKQLRKRFAVEEAAAFAFQQIVHYLLLVLLLLFVLNLVRIPLTFFTFAGGALAIGVGFGSQTIVNNFLSGLILMMERPVKIGDIVEVEQVIGTVEWLGARSTRIRTFDNLRLVVPNSTMLQNKIINWSLTDDILRRTITVGVMYGSPVRDVEQLLLQAAEEHALVERYPAPQVFFEDFGDSALIFVLLVWVSMVRTGKEQSNIRRVESDIRFRIDELFRQEGIVIAFPQRDLHIDSLKPIEVKLKQE